ncbi:RNA polymerase sigma factor [Rubinisphaera margarita]|uniref:RNA polymerase sigma factor n=1 Tax=Rubinisphaera margarita TaxID=2909586 RepID=UPI001EE98F96|nr:sigma-70 family RNA polymerase sigma factor [Rubinisphaera margarita]MCG6154297.1 sigma-70 family RNA polymerase sigma factor [Rubinisphaera margarita]
MNASTQTANNPYLSDPDVQLMLRVREGDEEAFGEIVEGYQDRVISIFATILGSQDAAEDLAQETFLRVYRARHAYEPQAKFSTWLFRIANNLASNSRRSKQRRKEVQFGTGESGPQSMRIPEKNVAEKSSLMPARQLDRTELSAVIQDALENLNDRQRIAVLLNKFEEMSYADIAETLELSPSAVKSLLSRARENLREHLENYLQT